MFSLYPLNNGHNGPILRMNLQLFREGKLSPPPTLTALGSPECLDQCPNCKRYKFTKYN